MEDKPPRHRVRPNPPPLALVAGDDDPPEVVSTPSDDEFKEVARYLNGDARCTAKTAAGSPCSQPVVGPGVNVCRVHGGNAPQVREAAIGRLREARDQALESLVTTLSSDGDKMDPRTLLDVVTKLTDKVELLEGRATERTESSEFKLEEVRATFTAKLDDLASSYKRMPSVLDMVDRMMGEGKYAEDAEAADG